MQIVIDIPSEGKYVIDKTFDIPVQIRAEIINAVRYGVVLPEHHGRLIDADKLKAEMEKSADNHCNNAREDSLCLRDRCLVSEAPTVLEGDKE